MVNRAGGKNDAPADQVRWEDILQLDAHQVEAEGWTDPSQDGVLAHLFEGSIQYPVVERIFRAMVADKSRRHH